MVIAVADDAKINHTPQSRCRSCHATPRNASRRLSVARHFLQDSRNWCSRWVLNGGRGEMEIKDNEAGWQVCLYHVCEGFRHPCLQCAILNLTFIQTVRTHKNFLALLWNVYFVVIWAAIGTFPWALNSEESQTLLTKWLMRMPKFNLKTVQWHKYSTLAYPGAVETVTPGTENLFGPVRTLYCTRYR
jgi:hypothetical protein